MNHRHAFAMILLGLSGLVTAATTQAPAAAPSSRPAASQPAPHKVDRSGRPRVGKASFYARSFTGKRMADGTRMDPNDDNAASKTLPLGTKALVTNLENGQTAVVTIQDRGPYVPGRIIDVSPATARQLGIGHEDGVAKVAVAPTLVPQADGSVMPGAGREPRR